MPRLCRRFLATAAGFLLGGVLVGLVLLVRRELFRRWPDPLLVSAHAHLILVGAVLETILGTALWLFPRTPATRGGDLPPSATMAWWLLTAGTVIRAGAEASHTWIGAGAERWGAVAGGVMQVIGLGCGVAALRERVHAGSRGE